MTVLYLTAALWQGDRVPHLGLQRSLQRHQGHIILLLPSFTGKAFEFAQQDLDERCPIGMPFEQYLETRCVEHLAPGVMRLHQAIAVEEEALSRCYGDFILLVSAPRHHPQRHACSPQFRDAIALT